MTDHSFYAPIFKSWQVKVLGPKPTPDQLDTYAKLGARHGKQCLAGAMALRECGVTGAQIIIACGAPQLNKMRGFITDALVRRDMKAAPSPEGHTVYKLDMTAKGLQRVKQADARAAKLEAAGKVEPVEGAKPKASKKATAKPRKAKVTPTEPQADTAPVPVTEPVNTDQPQA